MAESLSEKELALCDEQGFLFERSVELPLNSPSFIRRYMFSALAESLDNGEEDVYAFSLKELYAIVNASYPNPSVGKQGKHYPKEVLYWVGYLYRYWAFLRFRSSASLYRDYPSQLLFLSYDAYHTMDPKNAIENLEEDYLARHPEQQEKEAIYAPIAAELAQLGRDSEANRLAIDYLLKKKP